MEEVIDPDTIYVESTVSPLNLEPRVLIRWQGNEGILTSTEARKRAIALIQAVAMAATEGGIFKVLTPDIKPSKGFGKVKPRTEEMIAVGVLRLLREVREPLPADIDPIFGYNTHKPLIKYCWGDHVGTLELDTAKHHAQALLEVAEGAETDSFFFKFCFKHDMDKQVAEDILSELRLFRQQSWLEELL